jgi:hypothetical protein
VFAVERNAFALPFKVRICQWHGVLEMDKWPGDGAQLTNHTQSFVDLDADEVTQTSARSLVREGWCVDGSASV